ncbi:MAG: hypothetical protein JSW17_03055 [Candidatus Omnitrophota bacterium]|nr:MAG: hypothetical protein JSW17_03055 [Candidatus Omnitrophota bacterium]
MKTLRICFLVLVCSVIAPSIGVYAQRIGSPYRMPPRIQTQQTQQTQETKQSQQTKSTETKPAYESPRYKRPRAEPRHTRERRRTSREVQGSLRQRGKKLYLRTNQSVKKVEVFSGNKKLGELKRGRNFDITNYLSQAQRNQLKFIYHDPKGKTYLQSLSTHKYKSLAMPPEPLGKISRAGMPVDPLGKISEPVDPLKRGSRGMPVDPYGRGGRAMPPDPLDRGSRIKSDLEPFPGTDASVMTGPRRGRGGRVGPGAVGGLRGRGGVSMDEEEEEEEEEPIQARPNPMQRLLNFFRGRRGVAQQGVSSMGRGSAAYGEEEEEPEPPSPVSRMGRGATSSGEPTGTVPGRGPVSWDPGEMPQSMEEMEQMGR